MLRFIIKKYSICNMNVKKQNDLKREVNSASPPLHVCKGAKTPLSIFLVVIQVIIMIIMCSRKHERLQGTISTRYYN